jgi:hypothetical protein
MIDKQMQSNYIKIVGKIHSELEFSHEVFGEKFYEFFIEVPRLSDTKDILPVKEFFKFFVVTFNFVDYGIDTV